MVNATGAAFSEAELGLFEVIALFIGKSVQVIQLQGLLASRLTGIRTTWRASWRVRFSRK